uniref:Secreted protein n=1 Tax=Anguilla anguilla TaxID=7936 RepID=A0A0E9VB53_ANGAN
MACFVRLLTSLPLCEPDCLCSTLNLHYSDPLYCAGVPSALPVEKVQTHFCHSVIFRGGLGCSQIVVGCSVYR